MFMKFYSFIFYVSRKFKLDYSCKVILADS